MKPFDPRLLRTVPAARRPVGVLAATGVLTGVATIATAFALSAVVVAVVERGDLTGPIVWLLALFVARAVLAATTEWVAAWVGVSVSSALRAGLLRAWGARDADSRPDPGAAVSLATSGSAAVEPYAARYLPTLVHAAVVPALAVCTLVVVDWPSALVVALTLPLLPLFAALIGRATEESTQRRWVALAALSGHFLDVVRGLPTLVTYGRARRQVETVRAVSDRHRQATMETLKIAFLSSAALELLATISVAIVAVTVGLRLSHGSMALGAGLVAILLAPEAYWPVRRVGAEYHSAADGAVALDAILAELDHPQPSPPASGSPSDAAFGAGGEVPGAPTGEVRLERVIYAYAGSTVPVLRDLSVVAGPGLTVVTGPSGAGKSTLLDLVAGLRVPVSGTVTAPSAHYVTQRPFLATGSVRETLTIGHPAADEQLWESLRTVGLDGVVASLPGGLSAGLGDDGFGLSAGQRQRLALARAWLAPETVLLLDEPTAHLDPDGAAQVARVVADLAERRVVIAVTHRDELLAYADQHVEVRRRETAGPPVGDPEEALR
ncbi:MAG: thiol reductant ABC exporter subunit CydD [Terrabacter sp.]